MSLLDAVSFPMWMRRFQELPFNYEAYGLNDAIKMSCYGNSSDFLAHMQSRWNKETRTFHFGARQICPTIEEFRAILFIKPAPLLSLMPHANSPSYKKILQRDFGLTKVASEAIVKGHTLNLQLWHDTILQVGDIPRNDWTIPMFIIMVLAHKFLRPSGDKLSVKVLEVALALNRTNKDISGLVLAETLMGLNEGTYASDTMRGSPSALYIWLMEKIGLLNKPQAGIIATFAVQKERREERPMHTEVLDDVKIVNIMPWYSIPSMKYSMCERPIIILMGLERVTSYTTTMLHLQYGRGNIPSTPLPAIHIDEPVTYKRFNSYARDMGDALSLDIKGEYVDPMEAYFNAPVKRRRISREPVSEEEIDRRTRLLAEMIEEGFKD